MSLEECYKTFLVEHSSSADKLTLAEYLVYALMIRNQFTVKIYDEDSQSKNPLKIPKLENEEEWIWSHLEDLLANRRTKSSTPAQEMIEQRMQRSMEFIASQSPMDEDEKRGSDEPETEFEWPKKAAKRKHSSAWESAPKRSKVQHNEKGLDVLKSDPEYQSMKDIFEGLEVIRVNPQVIEEDYQSTAKIRFEFLKQDKGRRTVSTVYRGIVCTKGHNPSYKDLVQQQRQQSSPLPILVFNVNDSMVVNCFAYDVEV